MSFDENRGQEQGQELLRIERLSKSYPDANGFPVQAVADVSLRIRQGEVLGLVGESGCGKSTLGRAMLRLIELDAGRIVYAGRDVHTASHRQLKTLRREWQIIFQDPYSSLNPRHRIASIVGEPLLVHGIASKAQRRLQVQEMLALVGLPEDAAQRFPHEFSGGQRQRIAIARALILHPRLLIADEAVSALDVSIQSQIINLLMSLQQKMSLSLLFISHDLSVVRHVSDKIAVMYLGRIVETGTTEAIMCNPQHPYTQALISAIPDPRRSAAPSAHTERTRIVLKGDVPDPADPPSGCAFHTRCQHVLQTCRVQRPDLVQRRIEQSRVPADHAITDRNLACHLYPPL